MMSQSSQVDDGYSSSGSEHTIPSPPPTPEPDDNGTKAVPKAVRKQPKARTNTNKGTKLTPWSSLDEVLFTLALIHKPYIKKQGKISLNFYRF